MTFLNNSKLLSWPLKHKPLIASQHLQQEVELGYRFCFADLCNLHGNSQQLLVPVTNTTPTQKEYWFTSFISVVLPKARNSGWSYRTSQHFEVLSQMSSPLPLMHRSNPPSTKLTKEPFKHLKADRLHVTVKLLPIKQAGLTANLQREEWLLDIQVRLKP